MIAYTFDSRLNPTAYYRRAASVKSDAAGVSPALLEKNARASNAFGAQRPQKGGEQPVHQLEI